MITLQVGQCGNQLGETLFDVLHSHLIHGKVSDSRQPADKYVEARRRRELYFRDDREADEEEELLLEESRRHRAAETMPKRKQRCARAVLVDMEPRVINECLGRKARWMYDSANSFALEGGSGNNWAQGFEMHGSKAKDRILNLVRKEAERCDFVEGVTILQSVAGGTGSGLGTFLTGALRDEMPNIPRLNCVVFPHTSGEVVVQNYNTLLTMANLQKSSSGMICLFNDQAHTVCSRLQDIKRPELDDLNRVFARDLASGLFLPTNTATTTLKMPVRSALRFLCANPFQKCLQTHTVPQMPERSIAFSSNSWASILKQMEKQNQGLDITKSIITVRGKDARNCGKDLRASVDPFSTLVKFEETPTTVHGFDKSISALFNSKSIVVPLEHTAQKAWQMFSVNAYIHQYEKFGYLKQDMEQDLVSFEQLINDYTKN